MAFKIIGIILEPVAENPIPGCIFALIFLIGVPLLCCSEAGKKLGLWGDFLGIDRPSQRVTETRTPRGERTYTRDSTNLRAFVTTKNNSGLHLRSEKSLNSSSVVFAPEGSEVIILYYDQQQMRVNGKAGRWCRARYNGLEGWAWGWHLDVR